MLLYLWVNKYKHIVNTGFNLSSLYEFSFSVGSTDEKSGKVTSGILSCSEKKALPLFDENINDIKAIIGENGAGKSTILEVIIRNIMTNPSYYFDGFMVTTNFVFNRKKIDFQDSISNITCLNLKEVTNIDLVNFNRSEYQSRVQEEDQTDHMHGQIATSYLNQLSIIHYSPLLNTDNILNIEGLAGSTRLWETDYWHYYDVTTANHIVSDYNDLAINGLTYRISGESELLAHKSAESKRILELLVSEEAHSLPFNNHLTKVNISLNNFYEKFWETLDATLTPSSNNSGIIQENIIKLESKAILEDNIINQLENNLYKSFLYGALKYEYVYKSNFGNFGDSNYSIETVKLFKDSAREALDLKSVLRQFLKNSSFCRSYNEQLFSKIENAISYVIQPGNANDIHPDGFSLSLSKKESVKQFFDLFFSAFIFDKSGKNTAYPLNILLIDYPGLSSGEKTILSMFSRIRNVAKTIPSSQSELMLLLDEPEVTLHPQWQTSFISIINDNIPLLLPGKAIQVILTSHSPILISDLPKSHILFLEKEPGSGKCKISDPDTIENTFAANIHSLYANAFFLKDKGGAMGQFAKSKVHQVINLIKNEDASSIQLIRGVIDNVGEPLIKNQLNQLFYSKFPEEAIENIDDRIEFIQARLQNALKIKKERDEKN